MVNNSDIMKLTDEDVYFILYLRKVKKQSLPHLAERFFLCRDSVEKIVDGRACRKCYMEYLALEKYLIEPA